MTELTGVSADDVYVQGLATLAETGSIVDGVEDPLSVGSNFGTSKRATREIMPMTLHIRDARQRIVRSAARKMDIGFAFASALSTVASVSDLAFILPYNPRGKLFSDDGMTLPASHAARLMSGSADGQLAAVIDRLRSDPTSRRGVISIFWPGDASSKSRDVPCALGLQFLIRNHRLDCCAFMRSQSAALVLPYDIFAFTFMQEVVAAELRLPLGEYWHICTSYHYYEDEESLVYTILEESRPPSIQVAPIMPAENALESIGRVLRAEKQLRPRVLAGEQLVVGDVSAYRLDAYWQDVLSILMVTISHRRGDRQPELIAQLNPYYAQQLRGPTAQRTTY